MIHLVLLWREFRTWWKKWWKWVLFPVGLFSLLYMGRQAVEHFEPEDPPPVPFPDSEATVVDIKNAWAERDLKLEQLKEQHQERLLQFSEEQHRELEALESKSTEEVVAWFDKLSSS